RTAWDVDRDAGLKIMCRSGGASDDAAGAVAAGERGAVIHAECGGAGGNGERRAGWAEAAGFVARDAFVAVGCRAVEDAGRSHHGRNRGYDRSAAADVARIAIRMRDVDLRVGVGGDGESAVECAVRGSSDGDARAGRKYGERRGRNRPEIRADSERCKWNGRTRWRKLRSRACELN